MILDIITYLPNEILNIIYHKINPIQLIFINKEKYYALNYIIDGLIGEKRYDSYVRDVIRNDYNFIFKSILNRNFSRWLWFKNYKYNNIIYPDYIHFILYYATNNNSHNCYNSVNLKLKLSELKKDYRKNSRIKNNQWSN
jgi:hypothetical protein